MCSSVHTSCTYIPHHSDNCYSSSDHGQSYTGHLATTQRGERCHSWNEPHLLFHPDLYSELDGAANLCRNPGQLKDRIWCFTSESTWDYCLIPMNCSIYPIMTIRYTGPAYTLGPSLWQLKVSS